VPSGNQCCLVGPVMGSRAGSTDQHTQVSTWLLKAQ